MKKNIFLACALAWATAGAQVPLPTNIQDGQILHCWNWSYKNIKAHLPLIAEQGFCAVQTSPVQPAKQDMSQEYVGSWWLLYQPTDFKIADDRHGALGTKSELADLCAEADRYGIKVIVDVVANHLANDGENRIAQANNPDLRDDKDCWHWTDRDNGVMKTSHYGNRGTIIWDTMAGLPDLNTENPKVQTYVLDFLKSCIDCGVDGFRFDAAKHIGVPADGANHTFWPTVVGGAREYAAQKGVQLYCYGEILDNATGGEDRHREHDVLDSYTQLMSITASTTSKNVREAIEHNNTSLAASPFIGFDNGGDFADDKAVLWNESHDTYANPGGETAHTSVATLNKTWALVATRREASALYTARPSVMGYPQRLGVASRTAWTNKEVKAVNTLNNRLVGASEYLSNHQDMGLVMNERGTRGAVIVATGQNLNVTNLTAHRLEDGTYRDLVSGSSFHVGQQKINGTIGSTGIAVLLKDAPKESVNIHFNNATYGWAAVKAYVYTDGGSSNGGWPGQTMTYNAETKLYEYEVPANLSDGKVVFHDGNGRQYPPTDGLPIESTEKFFAANHSWSPRVADTRYDGIQVYFDAQGQSDWRNPHLYAWKQYATEVGKNAEWPGIKMDYDATTGYFFYNIPYHLDDAKVIVNVGNSSKQTTDLTLTRKTVLIKPDNSMSDFSPASVSERYYRYNGDATHTLVETGATHLPQACEFENGRCVKCHGMDPAARSVEVSYKAEGWGEVYAYVWGVADVQPLGPWPGTKMKQVDATHYTVTVPAGFEKSSIIFHEKDNASRKTSAIRLQGSDQGYTGIEGKRYYSLNIGGAKYATLCLEYPVSIPEGVEGYRGQVRGTTLLLHAIDTDIPANTGVVVRSSTPAKYDFVETDAAPTIGANDLSGTTIRLTPQDLSKQHDFYALKKQGEQVVFARLKEGVGIPSHRAFVQLPKSTGATQGLTLALDNNELTRLEAAPSVTSNTVEYFDLSGRRCAIPSNGLYIVNGKLKIVR